MQPMIKIDMRDGKTVKDCVVKSIQETELYCQYPELEEGVEYQVMVHYGRYLQQELGVVVRKDISSLALTTEQIVYIGVGTGTFLIILLVVLILCIRKYKNRSETEMKKFKAKMDNLEMEVAKECKEGKKTTPRLQTTLLTTSLTTCSWQISRSFFLIILCSIYSFYRTTD